MNKYRRGQWEVAYKIANRNENSGHKTKEPARSVPNPYHDAYYIIKGKPLKAKK
jgi:hypothetical protein